MYMTTSEIRRAFLDYFRSRGHEVVSSSSLVPHNDPSLLFTNAGMNQFKDVFLGREVRSYTRATTAQRCVRAGGKHNDLDNVGYTARHHTFFEMLGNFSFGDYFKKEAIHFAWDFLTGVLGLPAERLTVTVYQTDDEAYDVWHREIGIPAARVVRIGDNKGAPYASDNFWQMGDTGPCGPCTEIFYDHGADIPGGPPGSPDEDGDRFIEIWNIVFMQYNRTAAGEFLRLPKPSVDTGMGLERIAAVLQGVHSNYDIDLFRTLIARAAEILSVSDLTSKSLRVVADHIRSCSFLIADGVLPSNEGRGYVLRRIIRRAVRHGRMLGAREAFFYKMVGCLCDLMGEACPELPAARGLIEQTLRKEEEQFIRTLDRGLSLLNEQLAALGDRRVIPGPVAFKLYDTYGFPVDLTADVVRDAGYTVDTDGFNAEMERQRERARESGAFAVDYNSQLKIRSSTEFTGYEELSSATEIAAVFRGLEPADAVSTDEPAAIVLGKTPFYAECGGQTGDRGVIRAEGNFLFRVEDTQKAGNATVHIGRVELGSFAPGMKVTAEVDAERRRLICSHHSATHLLQAALRRVLGDHVSQKGSSVTGEHLRFDFSHGEPLTRAQIEATEALVNREIADNLEVRTDVMDLDEARKTGAMALFGEKYDKTVRVVSMGGFSRELCGGTHVRRTGDIGFFKIVSDGGIAAGVRRIEAVANAAALGYAQRLEDELRGGAEQLRCDLFGVSGKIAASAERIRELERENAALKEKLALSAVSGLLSSVVEINGVKTLVASFEGVEVRELRTTLDDLKNRLGSAVIVLASVIGGRVFLIAGVTADLTERVRAGDLVNYVAVQIDGRGGGRPDMAQGGGSSAAGLKKALDGVPLWLEERLG